MTTVKNQSTLSKVHINQSEPENVYLFVYFGAEIAADGDQEVTVKPRIDVTLGGFAEYRSALLSNKLTINKKVRLYFAKHLLSPR